ncbi:uncharacterized protein G2W53_038314 [Senna tora]|uniref:Uncharacterized protein n=1 Tax=Senna tora TaxID=362788 RepID=A0A834SKX2_9FABA|nr:uncharacterized protein G2W53_038314 [Senna tora]
MSHIIASLPYLLGEKPRSLTADRGKAAATSFLHTSSISHNAFDRFRYLLDSVDASHPSLLSSPTFDSWVSAELNEFYFELEMQINDGALKM